MGRRERAGLELNPVLPQRPLKSDIRHMNSNSRNLVPEEELLKPLQREVQGSHWYVANRKAGVVLLSGMSRMALTTPRALVHSSPPR